MKTGSKNHKRPESSKPDAKQKRRHVSDFEVETYWRYYAGGFDHCHELQEKTPRWWRRLGF